jgi:hypothetical protein
MALRIGEFFRVYELIPLIQQSRRACSDKNQNENPAALPFAMLVLFAGSNQKSSELIIDNAVPLSI